MNFILNHILRIMFILLGASDIMYAIKAYHRRYYFLCGFNIMFAIYMATYLVELCVTI